jgi:O-antigen ligase
MADFADAALTGPGQPAVTPAAKASARRRNLVNRLLLVLLVVSPLLYADDTSTVRTLQVGLVGLLFLGLAMPPLFSVALWGRSGVAWMLALALLILQQPALVAGAGVLFNLKWLVFFLLCFVPVLCLADRRTVDVQRDSAFVRRWLNRVFLLCAGSLIVSAFTGAGEVFLEAGPLQRRAFAWLGDSFPPVMVFFFFFYLFARRPFSTLLAALCIVLVMQAKMAVGMAVLGLLGYLVLTSRSAGKALFLGAIGAGVLLLPALPDILSANLHNFDYSVNNRLLSFNAGLEFFLSSPWFGVGANQTFTYLSAAATSTGAALEDAGIPYYEFNLIHNSLLRVLAEMGLTGGLVFLALCWAIVRRSAIQLRAAHATPHGERRALVMACALWLLSFVVFHQTTGWFVPGDPQLSWLVTFLALMNFLRYSTEPARARMAAAPSPVDRSE